MIPEDPQEHAMTEQEWLDRYKAHFVTRAKLTEAQAQACADAEIFPAISAGFEDDPEGAADSEMSYWSD